MKKNKTMNTEREEKYGWTALKVESTEKGNQNLNECVLEQFTWRWVPLWIDNNNDGRA